MFKMLLLGLKLHFSA